ncbi:MAG TPA: hypothetical protein PKO06_16665 [Candidatus Ozemobacteraceae bacterium]|nr:hypothetical protein [Candidatus Ozemobacteraceae bacterium]
MLTSGLGRQDSRFERRTIWLTRFEWLGVVLILFSLCFTASELDMRPTGFTILRDAGTLAFAESLRDPEQSLKEAGYPREPTDVERARDLFPPDGTVTISFQGRYLPMEESIKAAYRQIGTLVFGNDEPLVFTQCVALSCGWLVLGQHGRPAELGRDRVFNLLIDSRRRLIWLYKTP